MKKIIYLILVTAFVSSCHSKAYILGKYCKPVSITKHDTVVKTVSVQVHDTITKTVIPASSSILDLGNPCDELIGKLDSANDVYVADMYSKDRVIADLQNGLYKVKLTLHNGHLILQTNNDSIVSVNQKLQTERDSLLSTKSTEKVVEQIKEKMTFWEKLKMSSFGDIAMIVFILGLGYGIFWLFSVLKKAAP
jgi:hypothetical protein